MLEQGSYNARLIGAGTARSANQKEFVFLTFEIVHFYHNNEWKALMNEERRNVRMYLTSDAWDYTEERLKWLGFNGDFRMPKFRDDVYQGIVLNCEHQQRDGKTFEQWHFADFGGGKQPEPLADDDLRRLNARWNLRSPQGAPQGAPAAPPPTGTDDEPPF